MCGKAPHVSGWSNPSYSSGKGTLHLWFLCGLLCLAVKDLLHSRATTAVVDQEPVVISTNATEELSTDTLKVHPTEFALRLSQAEIEMTGGCMVLPIFLHTFQLQNKPIEITWSMT